MRAKDLAQTIRFLPPFPLVTWFATPFDRLALDGIR